MVRDYKTDKNTRILSLYHQLCNGISVNKEAFCVEHGITGRTFDRDIEDIRLFLSENYFFEEIRFDRRSNSYYITGNHLEYLDRMEVAIMAKVLLSSKAFRRDEMDGLLHSLFSVVSPHDAEVIKQYLETDRRTYEAESSVAIIKFLGDLFATIKSGKDISLTIRCDADRCKTLIVSPLQLVYKNSKFYLIAAEQNDLAHIREISVDKMEGFKVLGTVYALSLKQKYFEEKEK